MQNDLLERRMLKGTGGNNLNVSSMNARTAGRQHGAPRVDGGCSRKVILLRWVKATSESPPITSATSVLMRSIMCECMMSMYTQ